MFENELSLLWISKESYQPGKQELLPHFHREYFHYIYVIEGSGHILVGGRDYPLTGGHIACVPRGAQHGFSFSSDKDYVKTIEFKFVIHNDDLRGQAETLCGYFRCAVPSLPETLVQLAIARDAYYEDLMRIKLAELLVHLLKGETAQQPRQGAHTAESDASLYSAVVQDAICFIQENMNRMLSLDELARHCSLSKHYFARLFKEETGESPGRYMSRLRIEQACRMMTYSEYNISQIAVQLGFQNVHYFSRVFKQWKGVSPTEYIRTHNPALYFILTHDDAYVIKNDTEKHKSIIG